MAVMSMVSLAVSIVGTVVYGIAFSNPEWTWGFIILGIVSIALPPLAKKLRIEQDKKGKVLEVLAIIIGGFNFYCIIFAISSLPIFIGYLGWIGCGIAYKMVK